MSNYIDRLSKIYKRRIEEVEFAKEFYGNDFENIPPDARGLLSVSGDLIFIGVYDYYENKDLELFRKNLSLAASFQAIVFDKFEQGEDIDPSYVSMVSFKDTLYALAAGDYSLAKKLANHMGGRDDIEKEHDSSFSLSFGYLIKNLILENDDEVKEWAIKFEKACEQWSSKSHLGYAKCALAIIEKNEEKVKVAFDEILKGHVRLTKKGRDFYESPEQLICLWGLAFANLAERRGVHVQIDNELIPEELICRD